MQVNVLADGTVARRRKRVYVPEERLELSRGCPRTILSRVRIPFRHSGNVTEPTVYDFLC